MSYLLFVGVLAILPLVHGLDNGLALTPPMGWLSWERFRCNTDCKDDPDNCISEKLYKDMADRMASDGWLQAGYKYVNIDDCWASLSRSSNGTLVADPTRFPSGILALANYVHERGLELGIYGDLGSYTCGGYPGTPIDKITTDANTFAAWTVDSLKLDGCNIDPNLMPKGYPQMAKALNATGRPILYACSWPAYWLGQPGIDWLSIKENCNYWRLYDDIEDDWDSVKSIIHYWGDQQTVLAPLSGPGHWNDPDMIICGNFALSVDECIAQFTMWAIFAAPLYLSADLRTIKAEYRDVLLNTEVIAINQDSLGKQGMRIWSSNGGQSVWTRPLARGDMAVALLNEDSQGTPTAVSFNLSMIGINQTVRIRDVYAHADLGTLDTSHVFTAQVNVHSTRMFRLTSSTGDDDVMTRHELLKYGVMMGTYDEMEQGMMKYQYHDKYHHGIGGGDHDKQPHHIIGGGDHDKQPHHMIGGGDYDKQPHQPIGGGDHENQSHHLIGGDDHDKQLHQMFGVRDDDKQPHQPIIGGGDHDKKPRKLIGGGDHDKQPHQMIGGDDKPPHQAIIGGGDRDMESPGPVKKPRQPVIGGGDHDEQPPIDYFHNKQPHQPIIGGGDHDKKPHPSIDA